MGGYYYDGMGYDICQPAGAAAAAPALTYAQEVAADSPVGYWRLGEALDSSPAVDAAGNQDGVYVSTGGTTPAQTGITGAGGDTAVLFTAVSNGQVAIAHTAAQVLVNTFTIEAWVKRASTTAYHSIFGHAGGTDGPFMRIDLTTNQLSVGKDGVAAIVNSTTTITADSTFHHVVWTKAAATNKLYIDGVDRTGVVTDLTLASNTTGKRIAVDQGAFPFDGTIDEVAIYATALSAARVLQHYTVGST